MSARGFDVEGRSFLVTGVANRKSVAWNVGKALRDEGAEVIFTVRTEERRDQTAKLLEGHEVHVLDVTRQEEIDALARDLAGRGKRLHGLLHSIAFASFGDGPRPFHATPRADFLRSVDVSCFSLIALSNALEGSFADEASVVAVSISSTRMAAENYGYMAPIKAALDSAVVFLAKSFAARGVRFNALKAGPLKTSSSSGIPGYVDSYLYAEAATPRKRATTTSEVADAALFLLSPRSSGINAQGLVVDAGMEVGYFDRDLVRRATRAEGGGA